MASPCGQRNLPQPIDQAIVQRLAPYPKTDMRRELLEAGLVTGYSW
jgi:hypothetical protein